MFISDRVVRQFVFRGDRNDTKFSFIDTKYATLSPFELLNLYLFIVDS